MAQERLLRTIINADHAGIRRIEDPALTLGYPLLRMDICPNLLTIGDTYQHVLLVSRCDYRGTPTLLRDLRG